MCTYIHIPLYIWSSLVCFLNFKASTSTKERIRFWMDPSLQISFLHHTHHLSNHRSCQLWIKAGLKRFGFRGGKLRCVKNPLKILEKHEGEGGYTTLKSRWRSPLPMYWFIMAPSPNPPWLSHLLLPRCDFLSLYMKCEN